MGARNWITFTAAAGIASVALTSCSLIGGDEPAEEVDRVTINEIMGGPDYENIDYAAQELAVQEAIAQCMREEGWEYIPVEYPGYDEEYVEPTEEEQREQVEREGFGMVYYILYPDANMSIDDPMNEWEDPNTDYVSGLSEEEQVAYSESLYGTPDEQAAQETEEVDPETGETYSVSYGYGAGCQGDAYREVQGDDPTQNPEYWEALQVYYDEIYARYESDPRVVELNDTWAACMKDGGYEHETPDDMYNYVYTDLQAEVTEILGEDYYADPMEDWTDAEREEFYANATQDDWDELYKPKEPTSGQKSQLEEILDKEIALGLVNLDCSKDYNVKMADLYAQIEEEYALEHEDELKELAASLAGGE